MDSKEQKILEISTVVENLSLKLATLQAKVEELCRNTGDCSEVKKVNGELLPAAKRNNQKVDNKS